MLFARCDREGFQKALNHSLIKMYVDERGALLVYTPRARAALVQHAHPERTCPRARTHPHTQSSRVLCSYTLLLSPPHRTRYSVRLAAALGCAAVLTKVSGKSQNPPVEVKIQYFDSSGWYVLPQVIS